MAPTSSMVSARMVTWDRSTSTNPPDTVYRVRPSAFRMVRTPGCSEVSMGTWPISTSKYPSAPGASTLRASPS